LVLGGTLSSAFATNGYFSHGYGMKAKGMGGASMAMAQDGFAGATNPASASFSGNRIEVGADLLRHAATWYARVVACLRPSRARATYS
jgi:long-chain fatty acid transport protein